MPCMMYLHQYTACIPIIFKFILGGLFLVLDGSSRFLLSWSRTPFFFCSWPICCLIGILFLFSFRRHSMFTKGCWYVCTEAQSYCIYLTLFHHIRKYVLRCCQSTSRRRRCHLQLHTACAPGPVQRGHGAERLAKWQIQSSSRNLSGMNRKVLFDGV